MTIIKIVFNILIFKNIFGQKLFQSCQIRVMSEAMAENIGSMMNISKGRGNI